MLFSNNKGRLEINWLVIIIIFFIWIKPSFKILLAKNNLIKGNKDKYVRNTGNISDIRQIKLSYDTQELFEKKSTSQQLVNNTTTTSKKYKIQERVSKRISIFWKIVLSFVIFPSETHRGLSFQSVESPLTVSAKNITK